jgi:hypothetical protein
MPQLVHKATMMFALGLLIRVPPEETDRTAIVVGRQYSNRAIDANLTGRFLSISALR